MDWRPTLDAYEPSLSHAAQACARLVHDMETGAPPYWVTLQGVNGCGKTMLMRQVFEQAKRINPGNPANNPIWPPDWASREDQVYHGLRPNCVWLDERRMASRMRDGEHNLPFTLRHEFFVALDEVGSNRDPTNYVAESVGTLCETRLGAWSMFATNRTVQEIAERMDARIASRLIRDRNVVVTISARDYAMVKQMA